MNRTTIISAAAVFIVIILGMVIAQQQVTIEVNASAIDAQYSEQEQMVRDVAARLQTTNAVDDVFSDLANDCVSTERERLDTLLSSLQQLERTQLQELQTLYIECGNYFELQRALKAKRLMVEVQHLEQLYDAFPSIQSEDQIGVLDQYRDLASLESTMATMMLRLTDIQADIIAALIGGAAPGSSQVTSLVVSANEIRENISFTAQEIETARARI